MNRSKLVLAVLALAAAVAIPSKGFAQNDNNWDVSPLSFVGFDTCTGENISMDGAVYMSFNVTTDNSGGTHVNFQFRASADGVGLTSGLKYSINNSAHETDHITPGQAYSSTFTQHWKLISQGGAENGRIRQTFHVTINANGVLTAEVTESVYEPCL